MKIKVFTGVIQGVKNLEKQVNDFMESVAADDVTTHCQGGQLVVTVVYDSQVTEFSLVKPVAKKTVSKTKKK